MLADGAVQPGRSQLVRVGLRVRIEVAGEVPIRRVTFLTALRRQLGAAIGFFDDAWKRAKARWSASTA